MRWCLSNFFDDSDVFYVMSGNEGTGEIPINIRRAYIEQHKEETDA